MKSTCFILGMIVMCIFLTSAIAQDVTAAVAQEEKDGQEVLKKSDEIRAPQQPFTFDLNVIDYQKDAKTDKNEVKGETHFKVFVRGSHEDIYRSLVKWTHPIADQGKVMLMDGTVFWLYAPGTRNSIRISPAQRLAGLATSADIASVNFERDYKVVFKCLEAVKGNLCHKLILRGKTDEVAYYALELYISQATNRPVMCKYYAISGRLLKIAFFKQFKAAVGEERPHEIFIMDAVDENHTTRMLYAEMKLEEKPIFMYNKDYLPNIKD